ncbi:hypothetical protein JOE61_000922 [Nocardioides salarius]|uniref:Uncharacterized protein n=1 Tax=Nocardioides salarius TaxID=374513 RepID=A0ABS2M7F4_9ACTN|nr:hypothetical protein [Nocardioides salarius]MBM7507108.1 hypothetical protein [Nocardioides salarius]
MRTGDHRGLIFFGMGIWGRLAGLGGNGGAAGSGGGGDLDECSFCGADLDEDNDFSPDFGCNECASGFATYCCGGIYENGEDVCASCGEPL